MWSLGCLLFAGANGGRSPFESALEQTGGSLALAVLSGKVAWPEEASDASDEKRKALKKAAPDDDVPTESLRDVVAFLLRKDWRERPTAHDAVAPSHSAPSAAAAVPFEAFAAGVAAVGVCHRPAHMSVTS